MIQSLRQYGATSIASGASATYQFNCNVLNGLIVRAQEEHTMTISCRSGRHQLINNCSVSALNTVLAPFNHNTSTYKSIPIGAYPSTNQTITITLTNTHASSSKAVSLVVVYDNKVKVPTQVYTSFTDNNFSISNCTALGHYDNSSLVSSSETITYEHGGVSESQNLQSYNDLYNSLVPVADANSALCFKSRPAQLNVKSTIAYTSADQTIAVTTL